MVKTQTQEETVKAYRFTVQGQYHAIGERGNVVRHFKDEIVTLPEIVTYSHEQEWYRWKEDGSIKKKPVPKIEVEHALRCFKHVIRRIYLPLQLKEKYEDFVAIRIFDVVKRQEINVPGDTFRDVKKTPIQDMKEHELIQFCMFNAINVDLGIYSTLADKKMAVEMEWNVMQEQTRAKKGEQLKKEDLLSAPANIAVEVLGEDGIMEHHDTGDADGNLLSADDEAALKADIFG